MMSCVDCDELIEIVRGETIDVNIDLTEAGAAVDVSTMMSTYHILKRPSKEEAVAAKSMTSGNNVFVSTDVTVNLLGDYYLRIVVQHGENITIKDVNLKVNK